MNKAKYEKDYKKEVLLMTKGILVRIQTEEKKLNQLKKIFSMFFARFQAIFLHQKVNFFCEQKKALFVKETEVQEKVL